MGKVDEKTKEEMKARIRREGVEFYLAPATRYQPEHLTESDVIKMVEDNMDTLIEAAETKESSVDVEKLFSLR